MKNDDDLGDGEETDNEDDETRLGVDGFREDKGVVAGVIYESRPEGKTVLYNLAK